MVEITSEMSLLILGIIFLVSLIALVKGANYLLDGAERIGKYFKLPAFVIGALIVGVGTSLPELAFSGFAVFKGETSIVASNVIGSNIANILLVVGLASIIGRVIYTAKNLLKLEIPLLVISTSLFLFVSFDGLITFIEALVMLFAFFVYVFYLLNTDKYQTKEDLKELKEEKENEKNNLEKEEEIKKIGLKEIALLLVGIILLATGANFLVDSVLAGSEKFNIAPSVVSVLAIAIGTSLPEILVSVKAVLKGKTDLAFGNVFGSNVFNILMLTGILGLFSDLVVDENMLKIGLPFLAVTTIIFYVSAMAKRIYI
jgi:cation:H+ antiporter